MSTPDNRQSNIDRFLGFQELYDRHRPEAPSKLTALLSAYLSTRPELVVDVGCGTGLSTFVWQHAASQVIGVEPNPDMLSVARRKAEQLEDLNNIGGSQNAVPTTFTFMPGYSNQLALEDGIADIITCSQAFHWMEPVSTLKEFSRVLKKGGLFAAYDCDWPPALGWQAEKAYEALITRSEQALSLLVSHEDAAVKRDKEKHLQTIRDSGLFRFSREIVFHHEELFDAERAIGLALSQGGIQTVIKLGEKVLMEQELQAFRARTEEAFANGPRLVLLSYRLRLGVK